MIQRTVVLKNRYFDSVHLMQVAHRMAAEPGIQEASALLATEANRKVLAGMGYGEAGRDAAFASSGPRDLVIALSGEAAAVEALAADVEAWLSREAPAAGAEDAAAHAPRTLAEAVSVRPDSSVAMISVPGEFAAREARAALQAGLHVFLFSSRVPLEEELALKTLAQERGLLLMGPDCGTAYLDGAGLGFANAIRRGPIGFVGSTGTGLQEFSCLIHRAGSGLSHGLGTGSRDLSDAIGGLSTLAAIEALEADPATRVLTVLAKPPGRAAEARLVARLERCAKPVVLCLLGAEPTDGRGFRQATTIDEAAAFALEAAGLRPPEELACDTGALRARAAAQVGRMAPEQRHVRGLFAGGTFCYQSQSLFRRAGLAVQSNAPMPGMGRIAGLEAGRGDVFLDLGAEEFVEGRPHPMIDATLRRERLLKVGEDPTVAVLLLDFVLGANAAKDPVGDLLDAIRQAQDAARLRKGHLCVAASLCGTDGDGQGLTAQRQALADAGALVFPSNAQAAAFCREVALLLARKEVRPCP